jgi:hypothetical protein
LSPLPPTYNTLILRSSCALALFELDKEIHTASCRIVQDQNLQFMGWAAVVNNLEETTNAFVKKCNAFQKDFNQFNYFAQQLKDFIQDG